LPHPCRTLIIVFKKYKQLNQRRRKYYGKEKRALFRKRTKIRGRPKKNLMTQITKDPKEEVVRIGEPAKTEENPRNSRGTCHSDDSSDNNKASVSFA
jgi:hypothetical protein